MDTIQERYMELRKAPDVVEYIRLREIMIGRFETLLGEVTQELRTELLAWLLENR